MITRYRKTNANLRTQLLRIMKRAGVERWERLFQNLRSSRETELVKEHPEYVVVAWMGNSTTIARKHYFQVTEADFEQAQRAKTDSPTCCNVPNATPHDSVPTGNNKQQPEGQSRVTSKMPVLPVFDTDQLVPRRGVRQSPNPRRFQHISHKPGAQAGAAAN